MVPIFDLVLSTQVCVKEGSNKYQCLKLCTKGGRVTPGGKVLEENGCVEIAFPPNGWIVQILTTEISPRGGGWGGAGLRQAHHLLSA